MDTPRLTVANAIISTIADASLKAQRTDVNTYRALPTVAGHWVVGWWIDDIWCGPVWGTCDTKYEANFQALNLTIMEFLDEKPDSSL